jgi:hypothetical protein
MNVYVVVKISSDGKNSWETIERIYHNGYKAEAYALELVMANTEAGVEYSVHTHELCVS